MEKFLDTLLGTQDYGTFFALIVLAIIGSLVNLGVKAFYTRDPNKADTPDKFSIGFLFQDNIVRILFNLFILFPAIRFGNEFLGAEVTAYGAFFIGLMIDKFIGWIQNLQDKARPEPPKPVEDAQS